MNWGNVCGQIFNEQKEKNVNVSCSDKLVN